MTNVDLSWNNIVQLRIAFEYYLKDDTEWYIPYGRMILALSVKNHPFFRSPHLYLSSHRIHFQGARSRGVQEIMIISVRKYFLSENLSTSWLSILRWRSHTFSLYDFPLILHKKWNYQSRMATMHRILNNANQTEGTELSFVLKIHINHQQHQVLYTGRTTSITVTAQEGKKRSQRAKAFLEWSVEEGALTGQGDSSR